MPHDHPRHHPRPHQGLGHNARGRSAQWQTPHNDGPPPEPASAEPDFDLVEDALCEAALTASDPTSLLRLAGVPFVAEIAGGGRMRLLSYVIEMRAEVGDIGPGFAAAEPVYHPLPASRVRRQRRLRLVYDTPEGLRELALAEVRHRADLAPA